MDARSIFLDRVSALDKELELALHALEQVRNEPLWKRAAPKLSDLMEKERKRLRIESKEPSLERAWKRLHAAQERCRVLFAEYLACHHGVAARRTGVDNGLCAIADALLDELELPPKIRWPGFTVLSNSEYFDEMASIIRLRFPEVSIWNLPVAAHEFGHFLCQTVEQEQG